MTLRIRLRPLALATLIAATSCTGTAGTNLPTLGGSLPSAANGSAKQRSIAELRIHVPRRVKRRAHYVSPSTESLTLAIAPSSGCAACTPASTKDYGLTAQSPGCTSDATGTTCVIELRLAPGKYTGAISTYDGSAGCQNATHACNLLSSNQSFPLTIATGQSNVPSITLYGKISSILPVDLTPATASINDPYHYISIIPGTSARLQLLPEDADGDIILGPGTPNLSVSSSSTFAASTRGNVVTLSAPMRSTRVEEDLDITLASCTADCIVGALQVSMATLAAVGYSGGNTVVVTPPLIYTSTPFATITNGISAPAAQVFDGTGDLFVANSGANDVTEYAMPYSGAPIETLTGISSPNLLAVDANGDVAVGSTTDLNFVNVYMNGNFASPISISLPAGASALAFDSLSRLWIAYPSLNVVLRYPRTGLHPYQIPDADASTSVNAPSAIALDYHNAAGQSDNLYVINSGGVITSYSAASSYAIAPGVGTTLASASSLAFCNKSLIDNDYLAISGAGNTEFFETPDVFSNGIVFNVLTGPAKTVFDQYCNLFALSGGVTIFRNVAEGSNWLYQTSIYPPSGLSNATALAVEP